MGNCMTKPFAAPAVKAIEANEKGAVDEEAVLNAAANASVQVDGEEGHLRLVATEGGQVLLSAGKEPLPEECAAKVQKVIAENKEVAEKVGQLSMLSDMGINIRSSKSPAFMGLLVVEVQSAVANARRPWVQIRCEDDKSVYIKADSPNDVGDSKEPSTSSSVGGTSAPPALDNLSQMSFNSSAGTASTRRREFTWTDAKFVFVTAFSHSTMEVVMRDSGLPGLPKTNVGVASIPICKLKQGTFPETVTLMNGSKEVGIVQLSIRYEWLRGTQDTGKRFYVDKVTIDPRKLKGLKVISHVSNVNHWLLSHDNVWAALRPDHPALRMRNKSADPAVGGIMGAPPPSTAPSKLPSVPEATSSLARSSHKSATAASADNGLENDWETSVSIDAGDGAADEADNGLQGGLNGGDSVFATAEIGKAGEGSTDNAYSSLFEDTVMDALADSADDDESTKKLRLQIAGILSLVNERFTALEDTVQQQQLTIQELEYKLEMKSSGESVLPFISGRFGYGLGRPASKRRVLLFARRAQDSYVDRASDRACDRDFKIERPGIFLGMHKTDGNGSLNVEVPVEIATTPGHYNISALLPQDNTFAKGSLYILKPGTQCVVMDMDGTLTVGDEQVVAQFALNAFGASIDVTDKLLTKKYDLKQRHHSRTLARLWTAKGYQVVYLSGRQGSFYNLTMQWLINHNYPPGPIHLTRTHVPTLPIYLSVGNFKVEYMQMLKRKGFHIYAAYGNTGTDVRAYAAAGVPKSRTFTIGQAAGAGKTVKITNWTKHLVDVLDFPDATTPVPYVDVMWSDIPMYRNKAAELKEESLTTVCGTLVHSDSQTSVSITSDEDEAHAELNTLNVEDDDEESSIAGPGADEEMEASKAAAAAADQASKDAASMDRLMIAEPVPEEGEEEEDEVEAAAIAAAEASASANMVPGTESAPAAAAAAVARAAGAVRKTEPAVEGKAGGGLVPGGEEAREIVTKVKDAKAGDVIKSATAGAEETKEVGAAMDVLQRDGEKEEGAGTAVAAAPAAEMDSLFAPAATDDGFIVPPEHGGSQR